MSAFTTHKAKPVPKKGNRQPTHTRTETINGNEVVIKVYPKITDKQSNRTPKQDKDEALLKLSNLFKVD